MEDKRSLEDEEFRKAIDEVRGKVFPQPVDLPLVLDYKAETGELAILAWAFPLFDGTAAGLRLVLSREAREGLTFVLAQIQAAPDTDISGIRIERSRQ